MFKPLTQSKLFNYRHHPLYNYLEYKEFGRSANLADYTDQEITEMANGAYRHTQNLLVDDDYFVNLNQVSGVVCALSKFTWHHTPPRKMEPMEWWLKRDAVKYYYIENYYLVTREKIVHTNRHPIAGFLCRTWPVRKATGKNYGLFRLRNTHQPVVNFKSGPIQEVLYDPVRYSINRFFFGDDHHISDFSVEFSTHRE